MTYETTSSDTKKTNKKKKIISISVAVIAVAVLVIGLFPIKCPACEGEKKSEFCSEICDNDPDCEACHGTGISACSRCDGKGRLPLFFR